MVVGARTADIGEVQIYRSADLRHWEFESNIKQDDGTLGFMWECPDLFTLGETQVLMFSPQGVRADGYHNRNLFQSGYLTGKWQPGSPFVATSEFKELDHGHDFYAPQSFTTPDGRRVVIGWLAMWESPMPEKADGWAGMLSLPRELMLDDRGNVRMTPVKELETLRGKQYPWPVSELHNQTLQVADHASAMEISLCWDMSHSDAEQYGLSLGDGARLYVDNQSRRLVLSRDYPQAGLSGYRSVPLPEDGLLHLRIFIDHSSLEVFVNQGAFTLSSRIYPDPLRRTLSLFSQQGHAVVQQACAWELVN
jgi:beta-fructofuranosidase